MKTIAPVLALALPLLIAASLTASPANRLTYLDDFANPIYPSHTFPKLITPQWIGEEKIDVVVTFGIDDMSTSARYEQYLRPILERLKKIDGRAPVSIFSTSPRADDPQLQQWLREGLTFEVHTLSHPCPILAQHSFTNAANTFHGCVDLINHIPGNSPVAFRTPCCDSINSASPRLFSELLARQNADSKFLQMDSSITMVLTTNDPALPASRLVDGSGRPRFQKYLPFPAFATTIENYPYPYIHTRYVWEMPFVAPSDWQSHNIQGSAHPQLLEDWKTALDLVALKQGTFNFVFHPVGWSAPTQHVAFIDYALERYGNRIKFLNYREVHQRLTTHLLAGQPLRDVDGSDNGVRLLDLNDDGFLDVVIGNEKLRQTRLWDPQRRQWMTSDFPVRLRRPSSRVPALGDTAPNNDAGARFGVLAQNEVILIVRNEDDAGAWRFADGHWAADPDLLRGLELDGQPIFTARDGRDRGVRLRDIDGTGSCEFIVANDTQNAVFGWDRAARRWQRQPYGLPGNARIVNARGEDNGVRFIDFNDDGADDVIFSNEDGYHLALMVPRLILGFQPGWSREVITGTRGQTPEIPMIVRSGFARNNGAWFARREMWVQNEDVAHLPNIVQHHSYAELLSGFQPPALNPTQSLATIQVPTNFTVQLVAAEPVIQDPVFIDWGEDGRLWVVEMRDYPLAVNGRSGGVIKRLEDTDGDGYFEKATVFAENVSFPNGLLPWRRGALISASPEILFAEDTDGDGKADHIEPLYRGFRVWNQQHLCNGFDYGLDNWLYGANGDSGGSVTSVKTGVQLSISGRDFRFRPDTGEFEAIAGQTQFGRHRDDWGNWFGNSNPVWLYHYWIPEQYVRRNGLLTVDRLRRETATYPEAGRVFAIGRKQQRMNDVGMAGHVTSANSPTPYRDELFGDAFANAVFISEPVHNLIRCEILQPDGVSFASHRWNASEPREFLSSTDTWFRPTNLKTGPDGALYIADMYRQYIEHPEWIPNDIKQRVNLRAGDDRGRIYRVAPRNVSLRKAPRLDQMDVPGLVAALDHPNGWQRDTVQRLLVSRHEVAAVGPLRRMVHQSANAKARLQALCTLDGLNGLTPEILIAALQDLHPAVREHAVRLCEAPLRAASAKSTDALISALLSRLKDESLRVRYQLAFSLGEWNDPRAGQALAQLAVRDVTQPDVMTAIMSSAAGQPAEIFEALAILAPDLEPFQRLTSHLIQLAAARSDRSNLRNVLARLVRRPLNSTNHAAWQLDAFARLLQELEKSSPASAELREALGALPPLLASARALATDMGAETARRIAAVSLLGRGGDGSSPSADAQTLANLLRPATPVDLQSSVLSRLGQLRDNEGPTAMLAAWPGLTPTLRERAAEILLRRPAWTKLLIDRIGTKEIPATDFTASIRQRLLASRDDTVRQKARQLFLTADAAANGERAQLIGRYLPAVRSTRGDATRGEALFRQHCMACHRLRGEGQGAAPDLASVVDRSPDRMLIAILDPNRAVEDRYMNYLARVRGGDEFSGMLAAESANSITLVSAGGGRETILRADLETLTSTRQSLMPEGFEQFLSPTDIAHLLAYIDSRAIPPRTFTGNTPTLIRVEEKNGGALRLLAASAEIYGDGLAFETLYENLGNWNGPEARAVWTIDVPATGTYDVWLQWACQDGEAGDAFRFQIGDRMVNGTVPGTGSWDNYRARNFGSIELSAGRHRAVFQAQPPLRSFLIDLREVRLVPSGATDAPVFSTPKSSAAAADPHR